MRRSRVSRRATMIGRNKTTTKADMETTQQQRCTSAPARPGRRRTQDNGTEPWMRRRRAVPHVVTTRDGLELPLYRWPAVGTPTRADRTAARPCGTRRALRGARAAAERSGHRTARHRSARPRPRAGQARAYRSLRRLSARRRSLAQRRRTRRSPDVPLFLMGHSMGGAIAALYAIERLPAAAIRWRV